MAIRVLIVDDEPLLLKAWVRVLTREGMVVGTALNGALALEELRRAPYDVALVDIVMPEIDGLSLISAIQADPVLSHLRLIVVTASRELAARATGLPHVIKGGGADEMLAAIYQQLA